MIALGALLIVLRESLEGFLIVSILTGLAAKVGHASAKRYLLAGAGAAVVATLALGVLADEAARASLEASGSEPLFAAGASLLAVAILTYMIVWMYRHTMSLVAEMRSRAKSAVQVGRPIALFLLAFAAVGREGVETVLFLASLAPTTPGVELAASAAIGFAASALLAYLVFSGIVRLNVSRFFAASGVLLIFFAGGLLAGALQDLSEAHVLPALAPAWSTKAFLDEDGVLGGLLHALVGYLDSPSWVEAGAYVLYALGVGGWYLRGVRLHLRHHVEAAEEAVEKRVA
jgi:high-affinity iron transporter